MAPSDPSRSGGAYLGTLIAVLGTLLAATACSHPTVPAKAAPPPLEYLGAWGTQGEGLGELISPCCLATDSVGNVLIADVRGSSTLVHKFDRLGHPLLAFYVDGAPRPSSITIDRGEAIYLTHRRPGDLYIYFPDGSFFRAIRRISGRALDSPEGVAIGDNGSIYVAQADANRVLNINSRGRLLESWGTKGNGPGQFSSPSKIVTAPDGSIFVADVGNHRVERFHSDGTFVSAWDFPFTDPSPAPGDSKGFGLAVSEKFVVASDGGSHALQVWTLDGKPLFVDTHLVPSPLPDPAVPADVAIASNGDLLVLDAVGTRVLRFRVNF